MTSLVASLLATAAMVWIVVYVGRRRAPGTPLTWGEGYAAAAFVFFGLVLIYGILPSQWLTYADATLKWRPDKMGIPIGPLHYLPGWPSHGKILYFIPTDKNVLWPDGITFFGRGRIDFSAQTMRDIVALLIYGLGLGGQVKLWSWWQSRGKAKAKPPELVSAFGRPLVRKA